MKYEVQLQFFQKLLQGLHISSCVITDPLSYIPPEIDMGLRADLFRVDNYAQFLANSLAMAKAHTIYRFYDEYDCHYIFLRLPGDGTDAFFYIGPYLPIIPGKTTIDKKADALGISGELRRQLHRFYRELPIVEDENLLLTMAYTFAEEVNGEDADEKFIIEYVDYKILDKHQPIPSIPSMGSIVEPTLSLDTLEQNYANEKLLMEAISKGKLHLLTQVAASVFTNGTEPRLADSLRNRKNYLIILKTLLRKAAEYGGVHPLHIHRMSSHYAGEIENLRTVKQSLRLQEEMIRSYCQLVKNHSLSKYSYYVGQAITMVQYDLTADLRLKSIADTLNVNSSYLSNLFHKEYGSTLTDFVNRERINHAMTLLQSTHKAVQEIASESGIPDVNYFIKLFKRQTGFTPNQYREKVGK